MTTLCSDCLYRGPFMPWGFCEFWRMRGGIAAEASVTAGAAAGVTAAAGVGTGALETGAAAVISPPSSPDVSLMLLQGPQRVQWIRAGACVVYVRQCKLCAATYKQKKLSQGTTSPTTVVLQATVRKEWMAVYVSSNSTARMPEHKTMPKERRPPRKKKLVTGLVGVSVVQSCKGLNCKWT